MADEKPHLHVEFFTEAQENKSKSAKEGRPIFDDVEFVRIRFAGDQKNVLVAPAHMTGTIRDEITNLPLTYAQRFPRHYEAFRAGQAYLGSGTPVKEAPFLTEAQRRELAALNIHTLEALADMDGAGLARLGMGGRALKDKAIAFIAKASGSADVTKLAGENAAMKEQIEAMQKQMAELLKAKSPTVKEPAQVSNSAFSEWQDDDIKAFIEDRRGARPRGNPSHATLVSMADEIVAEDAAKQAA